MMEYAEEVVNIANGFQGFAHPLDIVYQISAEYHHLGKSLPSRHGVEEAMPELAQLVAASPFDAAIHDVYGRANNVNSYNALSKEYMNHDLSEYLDDNFKGEYLDQYTLRDPVESNAVVSSRRSEWTL